MLVAEVTASWPAPVSVTVLGMFDAANPMGVVPESCAVIDPPPGAGLVTDVTLMIGDGTGVGVGVGVGVGLAVGVGEADGVGVGLGLAVGVGVGAAATETVTCAHRMFDALSSTQTVRG